MTPGADLKQACSSSTLTLADVEAAAEEIAGVAHRTPVLTSRTLDDRVGASVFLKAECFQRAGSFKIRGAYNKISRLPREALERGVAAFSSGNHAQAVALAASLLGSRSVILMPEESPIVKMDATKDYGAQIVTYHRFTDDREELGTRLADERGLTLVPPYDDLAIIAGQGTVALELIREVSTLDALVVPVGGGGLIAGCATVAKSLLANIKVFGVEPERGDDTRRSLEAGTRVTIPVPVTIADGLQAATPGAVTFEVNRKLLDGIVVVSDSEIVDAMTFLFDRTKIVTEPSGATAVAAVLNGKIECGGRIGVVISGGNVGVERFAQLVAKNRYDA